MSYSEFVRRTLTVLGFVFAAVILAMAVSSLLSILLIVFTCWVLSVGMNAAIRRFQRYGMRRGTSTLAVFLLIILVALLIVVIVVPPFLTQIGNLVEELPGAVELLAVRYEEFWNDTEAVQEILPEFTVEDYQRLIGRTVDEIVGEESSTSSTRRPAIDLGSIASSALPILGGIGSLVGSFIANFLFIVLITGYLIADPMSYYRPFVAIVPRSKEQRVIEIINEIRSNVISWMGALSVSIAFTSITVTLALGVLLQIPNAVALGVISGLGALIPNIGYYIGLIPIIIFTAAVDPVKVIPAVAIYWLLNQFEASVVTPSVMKNELNIPAGVILPFQLIAASVMGFFGILLAVPILAILITLVRELYVFDELGKRGSLSELEEDAYGNVYLVDPAEQSAT